MDADAPTEDPARRRLDVIGALMTAVTVAALLGALWLRFGPRSFSFRQPFGFGAAEISVGAEAPPLRLLDLKTSEPLILVGLHDRVVWLVFWSAAAPSSRECLSELEPVWKKLKAHRRFALVTAAVEANDPGAVRAAVEAGGVNVPVYLASPETRRQFRAQTADPPLHVLIDAGGRVITMARHTDQSTIDRIAKQVRRRLDQLDPIGETRFASMENAFTIYQTASSTFGGRLTSR